MRTGQFLTWVLVNAPDLSLGVEAADLSSPFTAVARSKFYGLIATTGLLLWFGYCWLRYKVSDTRIDECFDLLSGAQQNICVRNAMESRDGAIIWAIGLPAFLFLFSIVAFAVFREAASPRARKYVRQSSAKASPAAQRSANVEVDEKLASDSPLSAREFLEQLGGRMEIIISEEDEPETLMAEILVNAERAGIIDAPGAIRKDPILAFVMDLLIENDAAYEWAQFARRQINPCIIEDRQQLLDAIYA